MIVQGVSGTPGGMGYFGFSYFEENQDTLKALEIDDGSGCVAPSADSAQAGDYTPLARPLFVYAKTEALERQEVEDFLRYMLENEATIAERRSSSRSTRRRSRRTSRSSTTRPGRDDT